MPSVLFSYAHNKYVWRKENRADLFTSRIIIRSTAFVVTLLLVAVFAFPNPSEASIHTWNQTDWSSGVGSSTTNQYSSATNLDTSTSGEFKLNQPEKLSNNSYDTDLSSWNTGSSEITPSVVETSVKVAATATSHSLPLVSTPQVGNILVASIAFNTNPGTITMPTGWVLAADSRINNSATLGRIAIYHKVVQVGDPTTIVVGNSVSAGVNFNVQEISGVDTTSPVDVTSAVNSGAASTATTVIPATATTTRASSIAVAGVVYTGTTAYTSWSNNFRNANATTTYGFNATKELTTKQTVNTTFTAVTSRQNAGALVVYKGALASQQNVALPGVVQSRADTSSLSHTLTLDSTPTVGNVLVAAISYTGNPGALSLPAGWVQSAAVTNTSSLGRVEIYHKVVQSGDTGSFVVTTTAGVVTTYTLHELSGIDTSSPVDQTSTVQSAAVTATTVAIPNTATTTTANSLAIARVGFDNTSAYTSWSNSFNNTNATLSYGYTATKILSSTQQVSTTFTGVTARRNQGAIAVYKAEGASIPAVVQSKTYAYLAPRATAARFLNPITQGNTLFATFMTTANTGTITPPSGWTQVSYAESASGRGTYLFVKTAGANESQDFFFNFQYQVNGSMSVYEVRGLLTGNPVDQTTSFANISANPLTFSIPTTTSNRAFILGGIGNSTTSGFPTAWSTNGFTTIFGTAPTEFQSAYKNQVTAAAYNLSFANASLRILQGYLTAFKAGGNYVDATRNTGTKYSGAASAKLESSPWAVERFLQNVNVGDTDSYEMTTYVYTDGSAVTSADAQLYYDTDVISTTYTSVGSGWYKLSATITGANAARDFGVEIPKNKTLYVDDFSVNRYQATGTLTSNIFDTSKLSNWGDLRYTSTGSGTVTVKARSSNDSAMTGAPNFSTCSAITTGSDISTGTNGCVTDAERYIQYQVTLDRGVGTTPTFTDIAIDYQGSDQTPPTTNASAVSMFKSNGGASVASNGWTNGGSPYFTWTAGADNPGGIGVAGYCVYVGQDNTADPVTTKGLLGTGDLDTESSCPFATANASLDLGAVGILGTALTTSDNPYYIKIKAIDANFNIFSGSSASFPFRFDNVAPTNPSYINAPSNFIATKLTTMTWPTSSGASADSNSGVAGLQYRIGASGTWYGDGHTGDQDSSDLLANDGSYTTQSNPDFADLIEGSNVVYFRTYDNAGNVSIGTVTTVLKINTAGAPSAPQNITATPSINTQNSFAFSWIAPATYVGNVNNLTYCYTINVTPTVNNCTYTAGGALSLSAGAYATQPGVNTIYVVAKDESGSINYATAGSAEFTANTSAPGLPLNPDIADTSVRASSNWRLVVSWEPPTDIGAGVSAYEVFRSPDGITYAKAGNTSGSSYVDTALAQQQYFYKVRACDSANNCGAYSAVIDKTPTGRFTSPPLLTSTGGVARVSDLQTRSVKISWSTDRNADSKVAFGTAPGVYGVTEAYNSTQTMDHAISIDNLTPGTTYFFVAKWTDTDGNTGVTAEQVFQTLPPPTVEDVDAIEIGLTTATIQYTTTGAASTKLYYGETNGFGAVIDAATSLSKSTYLSALKDLKDGTKYYYKINTIDASGFEYDGTTITFETPPAPKISNLRFQPVEGEPSSSQSVTWDTNVPSTSELSYGIVGGETLTSLDTALATSHTVLIRDLVDDSTYTLIARSRDANANLAQSDTQSFKTALDTRPPKVSGVTVVASIRGSGTDARGQIIVSWKTDEEASSQVAYGEGTSGDLGNSSAQDSRLTLDHSVVISDLSTSKVYSIQAISLDKGSNKAAGDRQSAIIGRGSESALGIIFSVLQKIFGVGL